MEQFFWSYVWPALIMVGQSLLLLVCLLVAIAFLLLADRKVWAAVQLRRGPNVVGPFGLFQSFADLLKFILKGTGHSGKRQQGRLPSGAAGRRDAGACHLCRHSVQ